MQINTQTHTQTQIDISKTKCIWSEMMRLYMSSSTFKTGEFAILVTSISKGCNGDGAVRGYYKFCLLRDFPTVTKSPPLPQLHSSLHPLMHKHTRAF